MRCIYAYWIIIFTIDIDQMLSSQGKGVPMLTRIMTRPGGLSLCLCVCLCVAVEPSGGLHRRAAANRPLALERRDGGERPAPPQLCVPLPQLGMGGGLVCGPDLRRGAQPGEKQNTHTHTCMHAHTHTHTRASLNTRMYT